MKYLKWIIGLVVLTVGAVICVLRWSAWFSMPAEPKWETDISSYHFHGFGDDSVPHFILTPDGWQDTEDTTTLRMVLFGDVHNSISREEYDSIASQVGEIDMYAQLGDFMERNYFYYKQLLYHQVDSSAFADLPVLATPGNHEYRKAVFPRLEYSWHSIFHNPHNGPYDFRGTTYYVDFPKLRFIALDTHGLNHLHDYTHTLTWLNRTIAQAGSRFVIVMMHHPVYSCGKGRQNILIRLFFGSALKKADLVFAGHDHGYARDLPFVNTNSAKKFYTHNEDKRFTRIGSGIRFYEVISITHDTLHLQTRVLETGDLYDEIMIICHGDQREILDLTTEQ